MTTRRKSRRTRGFGSSGADHAENFRRHSRQANDRLDTVRSALAASSCPRAAAALTRAAYHVGAATAENRGAKHSGADYDSLAKLLEQDLGDASDAVYNLCRAKPSLVERAKRIFRRKP